MSFERRSMSTTPRVLILCTGNSARSQMAEGLLRHDSGGRFDVQSAGVEPTAVKPEATAAMQEIGIDITSHRSKSVAEFAGQHFDYVITVCDHANEVCPVFPGAPRRLHWNVPDPAAVEGANRLAAFQQARDTLRTSLRQFMRETQGESE
jgi:arsenate reductase